MSAIAGIIRFGAPVGPALIAGVARAMNRRGPDGTHQWTSGPVALAHCLLRTGRPADAPQPIANEAGTLLLVMDGRLDNRTELSSALRRRGALLRDGSDAELLLHAFQIWKEECTSRLLGDFAFAVWDARTRKFFCAVDPMGARPFYYALNRDIFAFASDEEALIGLPGIAGLPNDELLATILLPEFQSYDRDVSWVRQVKALRPAQSLAIGLDARLEIKTYWEIEPGDEIHYGTDEEYQLAFREVFAEAVRCRMSAASSVAAMMSGGLDSANIAATAKRVAPSGASLHTYSAIHDEVATCVESRCIQSLTEGGDSASFVHVPSFSGMANLQDLLHVAWSKPHPCDNALLLPALMCLAAGRDGHRVLLHGATGDLVTDVPDRYIAYMLRSGSWRAAWHEATQAAQHNNFLRGSSPMGLLLLNAWTAFAPASIKSWLYQRRTTASPPDLSIFNPAFSERLDLRGKLQKQNLSAADSRALASNIRIPQAVTLASARGPGLGLSGYGRLGTRFGLEMCDPWADKRVVEFLLRLPLEQKVRHGWTKYLTRTALKDGAGHAVRFRIGKEHLGWHFIERVMEQGHDEIAQVVEHGLTPLSEYIDTAVVKERFRRYASSRGVATAGFDPDRQFLYEIVTLVRWLHRLGEPPNLSEFVTEASMRPAATYSF